MKWTMRWCQLLHTGCSWQASSSVWRWCWFAVSVDSFGSSFGRKLILYVSQLMVERMLPPSHPCLEQSFQQFMNSFTSERWMPCHSTSFLSSLDSVAFLWLVEDGWNQRRTQLSASWGTEDWCSHVLLDAHWIQGLLDAAQNMPLSAKEVSPETYFHPVLSMVMRQAGK